MTYSIQGYFHPFFSCPYYNEFAPFEIYPDRVVLKMDHLRHLNLLSLNLSCWQLRRKGQIIKYVHVQALCIIWGVSFNPRESKEPQGYPNEPWDTCLKPCCNLDCKGVRKIPDLHCLYCILGVSLGFLGVLIYCKHTTFGCVILFGAFGGMWLPLNQIHH